MSTLATPAFSVAARLSVAVSDRPSRTQANDTLISLLRPCASEGKVSAEPDSIPALKRNTASGPDRRTPALKSTVGGCLYAAMMPSAWFLVGRQRLQPESEVR